LPGNLAFYLTEAFAYKGFVAVEKKGKQFFFCVGNRNIATFKLQSDKNIIRKFDKSTRLNNCNKTRLHLAAIDNCAKGTLKVLQGKKAVRIVAQLNLIVGNAHLVELNITIIATADYYTVSVQAWAAFIKNLPAPVRDYNFHGDFLRVAE